mmetsp:Transcript_17911/g.25953  ORF Transcript_17911/g.25953 Transcript_17911/m.25953 type:complete len:89 (-) Transcript_17911:53-319(-)
MRMRIWKLVFPCYRVKIDDFVIRNIFDLCCVCVVPRNANVLQMFLGESAFLQNVPFGFMERSTFTYTPPNKTFGLENLFYLNVFNHRI